MRKRTKITMDPKYILMTIAIVSVALIIVSFRFQDKMTPIRTAVGSVWRHRCSAELTRSDLLWQTGWIM